MARDLENNLIYVVAQGIVDEHYDMRQRNSPDAPPGHASKPSTPFDPCRTSRFQTTPLRSTPVKSSATPIFTPPLSSKFTYFSPWASQSPTNGRTGTSFWKTTNTHFPDFTSTFYSSSPFSLGSTTVDYGSTNTTRVETNESTTSLPFSPEFMSNATLYFYIGIVLTGVLLNLCAIFAICLIRRLRNTQNMFVLNLYFADLLISINATSALVSEVDEGFNLDGICPIIGFVTFVPPVAIVLSMVVIAENRWEVITLNRRDVTVLRLTLSLILVWAVSIAASLPILLADMDVKTNQLCYCCFYFASNLIYGFCITAFMYILPNIAIAAFYISIIYHVRQSRKRMDRHDTSRNSKLLAKKGDIFLARQFIILFSVFNICYLPAMIVSWMEDEQNSVPLPIRSFVVILFSCNIIANPVLYFIMNKQAKDTVVKQIKCCKKYRVNRIAPQPVQANVVCNFQKQRSKSTSVNVLNAVAKFSRAKTLQAKQNNNLEMRHMPQITEQSEGNEVKMPIHDLPLTKRCHSVSEIVFPSTGAPRKEVASPNTKRKISFAKTSTVTPMKVKPTKTSDTRVMRNSLTQQMIQQDSNSAQPSISSGVTTNTRKTSNNESVKKISIGSHVKRDSLISPLVLVSHGANDQTETVFSLYHV